MTFDYYNLDTEVPDVEVDRIREDFEAVFNANAVEVEIIRHVDQDVPEGGDFFGTRTRTKVLRKRVTLFFYAKGTDAYQRTEHGITTAFTSFGAYALHDTEIKNNDLIKFLRTTKIKDFVIARNTLFKIASHDRKHYHGQFCYQDFDLILADKE